MIKGAGKRGTALKIDQEAEPQTAASIDLATKMKPVQQRAFDTFEAIVEATGNLLVDVGFERLSTNMICERVGISPPALYRYFPNKYAILKELGTRLMSVQDEVVLDWIEAGGVEGGVRERREKNVQLYQRVMEVTYALPGGEYILRVMRAVPILSEVRVSSSQYVSQSLVAHLQQRYPMVPTERLAHAARVSTEVGHSCIEAALIEPELAEMLFAETAQMIVAYYDSLPQNYGS